MKDLSFVDTVILFIWIKVFLGYSLLPQPVIEEGALFLPLSYIQLRYKEWLGGRSPSSPDAVCIYEECLSEGDILH